MRWLLVWALLLTACAGEDVSPGPRDGSATTATTAPTRPTTTATPPPASTPTAAATATPATPVPSTVAPTGSTTPPAAATLPPDAVTPAGFDLVAARVTEPDGTVCDLCLWLADTADQRRQGLMFVTHLGPGDGMAFRYPQPHTGSFWMKNTVLPLSIAFFAADGAFLDAFDMEPCTADPCPSYATPSDFLVAVEVPRGGLAELGMVPGSTLELLDLPCG